MAKVISFINQKGGTGKTTIGINLGCGLAHRDKRILIIDMDFQCNATTGLGLDSEKISSSSFTLLKEPDIQLKDVIQNTYLDNLKIIPGNFQLQHVDLLVETKPEEKLILKNKIDKELQNFDYILIDNPPSLSAITYNSLIACQSVYIPVEMSYFGLEGLIQIERIVNEVNQFIIEQNNKLPKVIDHQVQINGIIINKWEGITRISKEVFHILNERYSAKLFQTRIRNNTKIKEAIGEGIGIIDYAPTSHGAEDYNNLTQEVLTRES